MQRKNKIILHVIHSEIGGAGDIAFHLNSFNNRLLKTQYLMTGPKIFFGFKNKLKNIKKKIFFQRIEKGSRFIKIIKVIKKINQINPDVIILHNYQVLPTLYFKIFRKKKIIYVDHMSAKLKKFKDYLCILISALFFDKIIFVNNENFNKFSFIKNSKKKVIFNGSSDFFLRDKVYKKKNYLKIGISGRINQLKYHRIAIDLLKVYPFFQKKIKILIAGSGENKKNLIRYIHHYKLDKNVKFLGELDEKNLKKWFSKIDVYLHPSFGEAMSSSILQAMSSCTPILASNVNGVNNLIGKKKYLGLLFNNDIEDLKRKMKYFINLKKNEYKNFQKIQREYFLKNHDLNLFRMKYQKVIHELI